MLRIECDAHNDIAARGGLCSAMRCGVSQAEEGFQVWQGVFHVVP
ncbi:MAG: hypothetical protein ACN6QC_00730 [Paraburkholderia hospita]|jgi:hypothetical protein